MDFHKVAKLQSENLVFISCKLCKENNIHVQSYFGEFGYKVIVIIPPVENNKTSFHDEYIYSISLNITY